MRKKIISAILAAQLMFFGTGPVWAQQTDPNINQDQNENTSVEQEQHLDTNDTAKDTDQDQKVDGDINQDQNATDDPPAGEQKQSVEVKAGQKQSATEADEIREASQKQKIDVDLTEGQNIGDEEQKESTKINTNQEQTMSSDGQADLGQGQKAYIKAEQEGVIDIEEDKNKARQDVKVKLAQGQTGTTDGDAKYEQKQSVEAKAEHADGKSEKELDIKAGTANVVEIIKEGVKTFVKVVQSYTIGNDRSVTFEDSFELDDSYSHKQVMKQTFAWGSVFILNSVFLKKADDGSVFTNIFSLIKLKFSLPKKKKPKDPVEEPEEPIEEPEEPIEEPEEPIEEPEEPIEEPEQPIEEPSEEPEVPPVPEEPAVDEETPKQPAAETEKQAPKKKAEAAAKGKSCKCPPLKAKRSVDVGSTKDEGVRTIDTDGDGLSDLEERKLGTNPFSVDSDCDGLSDYLEVKILETNPVSADTDKDGLNDFFEVVHQSEDSFDKIVESVVDELIKMDEEKRKGDREELTKYVENVLFLVSKGPDCDLVIKDFERFSVIEELPVAFENAVVNLAVEESDVKLDPTKKDTVDNGKLDGDEDFDGDGLNNLEEQKRGAHPYKK